MDCKETIITGIGVSPGIGIGQAYIVHKRAPDVERRTSSDPAHERERLARALAEADQQIASLAEGIRQRAGESEAAIFEAHRMMLQDPEFRAGIEGRIDSEHASAEHAVQSTAAQYIAMFDAIDDDYLKARAADVQTIYGSG